MPWYHYFMINTKLLKTWIDEHQPKGREKFAAGAEISVPLVDKIISSGHAPNLKIIKKIARLLGTSIDELVGSDSAA
jgi:transcriptional regulator with XRE-family HTH domain